MSEAGRTWQPVELPAGVRPPAGAYSPALVAGDLIFVSGQVPLNPETGERVGETVEAQTRAVLANLSRVLGYAGATLADVVSVTAYLADIGDWVYLSAVEQVGRWRERFGNDFQVSINTSQRQWIDDAAAMSQWFDQLQKAGIDGQALCVEITENLLLEARDNITNRLLDFHDAGIQISIDDFGTGYSSLSYLRQFEIDYLKIDRSFIRNLQQDQNDHALCEAIIAMAHKLDIEVIAEGVENAEQEKLLKDFGCDYAQGFYYSRPVSAREFEALIEQRATTS